SCQQPKDEQPMEDGAGQDKEVPNKMVVGDFSYGIEKDAQGIGSAPQGEVQNPLGRKYVQEMRQIDHDEPAHHPIEGHGEHFEPPGEKDLEQGAKKGDPPDQIEQRPSLGFQQQGETDRGIGA